MNQTSVIAECQALVSAFAYHVDHFEGEKVVNLFTKDGIFERKGEVLKGQEEIRAAQGKRVKDVVVRHVCAPTHIELLDAEHARGNTYFQIFRAIRPEGGQPSVLPMPEAEVLGQFEDQFVLTSEGWRISARRARGIFRRGA